MTLPAGEYHVTEPPTWASILDRVDATPRGESGYKEIRLEVKPKSGDQLSARRAKKLGHVASVLIAIITTHNYGVNGYFIAEGKDFIVRVEPGTPDSPNSPATAQYVPISPAESTEDWRQNQVT